jgi:lipoate-protein ligase A
LINSARERVTSINEILPTSVPFEEVVSALAKGFEESLGLEFERSELNEEEMMVAEQVAGEKYGASDWNHMR